MRAGHLNQLTGKPADTEPAFSPDGRTIAFVRDSAPGEGTSEDFYSVRPSGAGLARLTHTAAVDEFEPRYVAGGIVFSRGESSPGPAEYARHRPARRTAAARPRRRRGLGRQRLDRGRAPDRPRHRRRGSPDPVGRGPAGVTVDGGLVWVANSRSDQVTRVDPSTRTLVGLRISVGERPGGIDAGTSTVWVVNNGDGTITRIEP